MEKVTLTLADDCSYGKAGTKVTLALTPADVHSPQEITNYLAGYRTGDLRGGEAARDVMVDKDSDQYRTFDSGDAFEPVHVKGSLEGAIPEVSVRSSLSTYAALPRFIGCFIPERTSRQATYDVRMASARRIRRALDMDFEIDVWTLLGTNTNWASAQRLALGATEVWNGGSASDPVEDLHTAIEASDQKVDEIWMNRKAANAFLRHDKVRDWIKGVAGNDRAIADAQTSNAMDVQLPGLPPIHILDAKYKPTTTMSYFLGNVCVLLCNPPGVPMDGETIASAKCFRTRGPNGNGFSAREFVDPKRGPDGGTMLVVSTTDVLKMTASSCGGIITGLY
jgi:hypothetical protein